MEGGLLSQWGTKQPPISSVKRAEMFFFAGKATTQFNEELIREAQAVILNHPKVEFRLDEVDVSGMECNACY